MTIKLTRELKQKIKAEARLRGKSCSAIVRDSVEKDLVRVNKPSLYDRLEDLVGKGDSGVPDLATNPKYMEGFGKWRK